MHCDAFLTQKNAHYDSDCDCCFVIRDVIWRRMMEIAYFQLLIRLIKTSNAPISLFSNLTGIFCNSLNRTNMLLSIAIQSVIRRVGVRCKEEEKSSVLVRCLLIILSIH